MEVGAEHFCKLVRVLFFPAIVTVVRSRPRFCPSQRLLQCHGGQTAAGTAVMQLLDHI